MTCRQSRRDFAKVIGLGASGLAAAPFALATPERADRPNITVMFIDDLGYGDIGPFGSKQNRTPHLDRMADEGMRLTSFYVAAPVCTPSRAALLTGCYPKRVGLDVGSWGGVLFPRDSHGLNPDEVTVAQVLRKAGYATGCFGKWHLGDQPEFLPTRQGFDDYFGVPYSNDMWPSHPGAAKWRNGVCPLPVLRKEKVLDIVEDMEDQAALCKRFTEKAVGFIRKNKSRPFFAYIPHAFVHHPRSASPGFLEKAGIPPETQLDEKRMAEEREYLLEERTRAVIAEVDWSVGEILGTLEELGLQKNTLVLFTSDNGGSLGCSNAPLRGGKGSAFEGGMRVPTVAWWPGSVPAGSVCDEVASTMDLLPTFAKLAGGQVPADRTIDGRSIDPLLLGVAGAKSPHEAFFYHRGKALEAVRSGPWKLHTSGALYNLDADIAETQDVAEDNPEVVARLRRLLERCRSDLGNPDNCRPVGKHPNPSYLVSENGTP